MEQTINIFEVDRVLIHNWIHDHIEEEYKNSIMKKMIMPLFSNSGKKLRPLIAVYLYRMISGDDTEDDRLKALCSAIEISHNASLIVDDVFDKDTMRRGEESFYVKFGTFAALSGAYNLSAFVFDLATRTDNSKVVREIGRAGSALSAALFMSKDLVNKHIISKEHFMDILFKKTTSLFEASAKCSALLSVDNLDEMDEKLISLATEFGRCYGDAYQLRDDVLGIVGSIDDLGKLPNSDIENRFQSLITIYAMEDTEGEKLQILKDFYLKGKETDIEVIRKILVKSGAVERVMQETIDIKDRAMEILDTFEESISKTKLTKLLELINFDSISDFNDLY